MAVSGSSVASVKPFEGDGFGNWDFRVRLLLEHYNVVEMLEEDPPTDTTLLTAKLENVLSCKNLAHNLISVKQIEAKGLGIIFENRKITVSKSDNTELV